MKAYLMATLMVLAAVFPAFAAEPGLMDKDELKAKLGSPDLVILDVRTGRDWSSSEFMIKGAVRQDPDQLEAWVDSYAKDQTIVLYCS